MPNYQLHVTRCDNRLVVRINQQIVYDQYYDSDPTLSDTTDLNAFLQPYPAQNLIEIEGYNGPTDQIDQFNPWHFEYSITKDSQPFIDDKTSSGGEQGVSDALVFSRRQTLVLEPPQKD